MITILTILFVISCVLLVFMVVITPSQEGGLASAFGGMGGDSFFGTKAARHVNRFTLFLAISFLSLAIIINWLNTDAQVTEKKSEFGPGEQPVEPAPKPEGPNNP